MQWCWAEGKGTRRHGVSVTELTSWEDVAWPCVPSGFLPGRRRARGLVEAEPFHGVQEEHPETHAREDAVCV